MGAPLTDAAIQKLREMIISGRYPSGARLPPEAELAAELGLSRNTARISAVGSVDETDDDEWLRVLNINVVGMARVSAAVLPWFRKSPCASVVNPCSVAALDARQATGRMVTPEEVAAVIVYLSSPLSASTTGTALVVDGGITTLRVRPQSTVSAAS